MKLPVVAYGDPVLRKKAKPITKDYPEVEELIGNMYDTMYGASGIGLAAPQIGLPVRMFVVDATPFGDDEELSASVAASCPLPAAEVHARPNATQE